MKNVKFRGIPRQKDKFRGEIPRLKYCGKTQIPRLGSKFRGPRKTVGPTDQARLYSRLSKTTFMLNIHPWRIQRFLIAAVTSDRCTRRGLMVAPVSLRRQNHSNDKLCSSASLRMAMEHIHLRDRRLPTHSLTRSQAVPLRC